jgi:hypothetical protein
MVLSSVVLPVVASKNLKSTGYVVHNWTDSESPEVSVTNFPYEVTLGLRQQLGGLTLVAAET